jgi:outer membrane protein TolC
MLRRPALLSALALIGFVPARGIGQQPMVAADTVSDTASLGPRLSLETVVARTLAHNPGVASAQGAVRDAAALRRVTLGAYLPSVFLNSSAGWSDQSLATAGASGLAPGSSVNAYGAGLAAAIDVFTGGRRGAQRSEAEAITQAADAGLVQQRYATILLARQGYFGVLRAHELVRVALETVAQAERGLGYARDRERAGTATRADVLLAQLAASTARRQWLTARDTLGMTTAALGRLVGADGPMDADALIALDPVPLALSDSGVFALAPAAAPLVVNTQALANASAAAVRASETQYLPTISLGAGYNWSNDGRLTGALRSGWIVALSTSFPLFNGFVREASVTQAKVAAEVATSTSADAKRFVRAEAHRLLGNLRVAEQDIALSRESVRLATEELRVIQARYRAGIATILDVLTSQTALVQADLAFVSARFTYQIARASLEALLGRDL